MKYKIAFLLFLLHIVAVSILAQEPVADKREPAPSAKYSESLPYTPQVISSSAKIKKEGGKAKLPSKKDRLQNESAFDAGSVSIPISIFDRGKFLQGVTKNEIEVFIDDQKQEILDFRTHDTPVEVIFLVDTSPSTLYSMDEIKKFLIASIREFKADDKISIVSFDGKMKVLIDSSSDKDALAKAIRKLRFGNGTSLYDAVAQLSEKKLVGGGDHRAIVLITDGVDTTSRNSDYNSSVLSAQTGDSTFFPVYVDTYQANVTADAVSRKYPVFIPGLGTLSSGASVTKEEYEVGKSYLTDLLNLTGGRAFLFSAMIAGATGPTLDISREIRLRYTATVRRPLSIQEAQIKRIKVRVARPNLTVLTKRTLATTN